MIIYAKDFGVLSDTDCTLALNKLLKSLSDTAENKTVIFEKGNYYLSRKNCDYIYSAITNTTAAEEYINTNDEVNMHYVPFIFKGIKNLIFDGNNSVFYIDGKVTNAVISECENITLKNITLKTLRPNMHKFTVISCDGYTAEFELWRESPYRKISEEFFFDGNGYKLGFFDKKERSGYFASIKPSDKNHIFRNAHPFKSAEKIEEIGCRRFRLYYNEKKEFEIGQTFYVYNNHRSDTGIFAEKSQNIVLDNIEQNFNYSLAFVAQDCTDLTVQNCKFTPDENTGSELASLADFIQICMCSGKIRIENNIFDGAADDALNVHGIHFKVDRVKNNTITVSFRHPQTWGFNPLHIGDRIEFIDPESMLSIAENRIINSTLTDSHHIELKLDKNIPDSYTDYVIEDIDRCPELLFENNVLNRIITRGILYTSRGKCIIKNNRFINCDMSGILISDDAKSWFESGMCLDITIESNAFECCGQTPILIKPENTVHKGAVHKNIIIKNNVFKEYDGYCIDIKSTENIEIYGNDFGKENAVNTTDCINSFIE